MTTPQMWEHFAWRGHEVVVIQLWEDSYGRPMLRFADPADEEMAAGMPVAQFLAEATPTGRVSAPGPNDR